MSAENVIGLKRMHFMSGQCDGVPKTRNDCICESEGQIGRTA